MLFSRNRWWALQSIWLALIRVIYSQTTPFYALNPNFFPTNEVTLHTNQSDFKVCLQKKSIQIGHFTVVR